MSAVATQATVPDAPSSRRHALLPALALAAFALVAVAWEADYTRGVTFWSDDWGFIVDRRAWDGQALFASHNGHLVAAHALVYKLLFEVFGLGSVWPYKLLSLGLHLLVVALLYVYARRRVSSVLAAVAAGLFVIFGSAAEVLAWQFHAGNLMAVSAGLGALLCLERRDRRRDLAAALLLGLSLASSSFGAPFVLGAIVEIALGRDRLRRWWVPAVPIVPYLAWRLQASGDTGGSTLAVIGSYAERGLARSTGALLALPIEWGIPLLIALVALLARRLLSPLPVPPRLWATVAMAIGYWLLIAVARGDLGEEFTERYLYPGALLILLFVLELGRGAELPRRALPLAAIGLALVTLANLGAFERQATDVLDRSNEVAISVAALEVAGDGADPRFVPSAMVYGRPAGRILAALDDLGSPYDGAREIRRRPAALAGLADGTLAASEGVVLQPGTKATGCRSVPATLPDGSAELDLPPGGLDLRARAGRVDVFVRRYAAGYPLQPNAHLEPGGLGRLAAPRDGDPATPWRVRVQPASAAQRCGG
jgi:hypothetical protein